MEEIRKIIHIDMDAFFASVEQNDNPELRNKPVAVGGGGDRGVVAAASYEARKFGVRSAMPSKIAKKRCPSLIFVRGRHERYKEVSNQIMSVFFEFTDLVEPLSIDEAFLDVTHNKKNLPSATLIAREIKARIKEVTGLTASAGISVNKFLAKIASDYRKPDGLFVITPEEVNDFIENLNIDKFFGVGKVTADKMHRLGIFKGRDLKTRSLPELIRLFGKAGAYYFQIVRGIDNRPVNPNRIRKSVGTEHTFLKDLAEKSEIIKDMEHTAKDLLKRIERSGFRGRTLTLKVKYSNFEQVTRSKTIVQEIDHYDLIMNMALDLLNQIDLKISIRLIGLSVSNHIDDSEPLQLTFDF
ncbi:DNA polymerase IV [Ancylomarina longa]|uniref:DNA polymerase IV n=1 Tax=Ancylomarina longa TaxID=2487017 RepID=A0A434AFC4_9BACT|nr:DNA polymerase IV [Ancylomarina longa]RUT73070.1 DNA polymerase IV [Ancylomarina longa]